MYVLLTRTEPNSVLKRGMLAGKFAILTCSAGIVQNAHVLFHELCLMFHQNECKQIILITVILST